MPIDDKNLSKAIKASYKHIVLRNGPQVGASQTDLEIAATRMKFAGKVVGVSAWGRALAGTVTVKVHKNDATVLSGDITPTAGAHVDGSLSATASAIEFAVNDELQVKVTTAASSSVDDLCVTVTVRPLLNDEAAR